MVLSFLYFQGRPAAVPQTTRNEFQILGEVEARKFAEANDETTKLKAAEELYGKMMVLFLTHMGLQLQKSQEIEWKEPDTKKAASSTGDSRVSPLVSESRCAPCAQAAKANEKKDPKKLTVPDKFKSTGYLNKMEPPLRNILGVFGGKLSYFAGSRKGKTDPVLIEVNLRERENLLDGEINVILTDEEGTPYSRNRGKGGNKTIRFDEKDRMVYVEASPNSFFAFKLFQFSRNELSGEYYEDNAMVGKALLYRQ